MKRHRSLQPLSRDHHEILLHARELRAAAGAGLERRRRAQARFRRFWGGWLRRHFEFEERRLPRLIPDPGDTTRLRSEHEEIRSMAEAFVRGTAAASTGPAAMLRFAARLHDHVRWEERHLFPAIEDAAGEEPLRELESLTRRIEAARPRSRRRRR